MFVNFLVYLLPSLSLSLSVSLNILWQTNTCKDIYTFFSPSVFHSYTDFALRMFGKGTIVFDGYSSGPSTKDVAQLRRMNGCDMACDDVSFDGDMLLCETNDTFLANPKSKGRFISLMSRHLSENEFDIVHAAADADCLIVQTALDMARTGNVVLIGEDTDLLILLLHNFTADLHPVFFTSSRSSSAKSTAKVWDISNAKNVLGTEVCKSILFFTCLHWL